MKFTNPLRSKLNGQLYHQLYVRGCHQSQGDLWLRLYIALFGRLRDQLRNQLSHEIQKSTER